MNGGCGDVFLMCRWLSALRGEVGDLTVLADGPSVAFLRDQFEDLDARSLFEDPGPCDGWMTTEGLASHFGAQGPDSIPAEPYLRAPRHPFRDLAGDLRVGIVWAGGATNHWDAVRSTRLADWAPVLGVAGASFYSLQVGPPAAQLADAQGRVTDLAPELSDWCRTAAAIAQLDLVISVDTAVPHLAGGLGVPVWVCLSACAPAFWLLDRRDSPLYRSAFLFRQRRIGEWPALLQEVASVLQEMVVQRGVAA
jgi:hypothetical protein